MIDYMNTFYCIHAWNVQGRKLKGDELMELKFKKWYYLDDIFSYFWNTNAKKQVLFHIWKSSVKRKRKPDLFSTDYQQPVFRAHLISIYKQELVNNQWEKYIQEEDLVAPDDPLLLCLLMKPPWPFVLNKLILKVVFAGHVRYKLLFLDREQ